MTSAEYIQAERLWKAGRVPEYTLEYLDARKRTVRKEMWCARNWLRGLICCLPYAAVSILNDRLSILWVYKFGFLVASMGLSTILYSRAFDRAVQKRLEAEMPAPED
jgi:hypothetical protein